MKNILILEPATSGLELLYHAYCMGLRIFVLTANKDERIIPSKYKKYIHQIIEVDTNNFSYILEATRLLHTKYPLAAVIPGFEIFVAHAARLSSIIHVLGVSEWTGEALRDKGKMRTAMKNAGVYVPNFLIINSNADLKNVSTKIGFPCVIKPVDQSGSVHVSRINNFIELQSAYIKMCNDTWSEMGKGIGTIAIVEEYISGKEFSVEGFVNSQGIHIISITEKYLGEEPYFVEMGHIVPATIDNKTEVIIRNYVHSVLIGIRMNIGVFHCEIRIQNNKAVLMEIAGRLAGDKICDLIFLSSGINIYKIMLETHLGYAIHNPKPPISRFAGIYFFSSEKNSYQTIYGKNKLENIPGFNAFKILIQPNHIIPPLTSFQGRLAYTIFTADDAQELKQRLNLAKNSISFE